MTAANHQWSAQPVRESAPVAPPSQRELSDEERAAIKQPWIMSRDVQRKGQPAIHRARPFHPAVAAY
jgi:hypothetical protein